MLGGEGSGEDLVEDLASDVGESVAAAIVEVGELLVVETEQVEHRGMEVMDGAAVDGGLEADLVKLAVGGASLDAGAGHEHAETVRVVVSATVALGNGHAAELTAPDDECGVDEAGALEVGEEGVDGAVGGAAVALMVAVEVAVGVPFAVAVDLDEADTSLDEAAGEKAFGAEGAGFFLVEAVHLAGGRGFGIEVDEVGGFHLHAGGELEAFDAAEEFGLAGVVVSVAVVERGEEVELPALIVLRNVGGAGEVDDGGTVGSEEGSLIGGWEEAGTPVEVAALDALVVAEDDVAREFFVFGAEAERDPGAGAGESRAGNAGIDLVQGGDVVVGLAVEGLHEGEVIGMFGDVGVMFAEPGAGVSVLLEGVGGLHEGAGIAVEDVDLDLLAVAFGEFGLGVEEIDGAGGSFHKQPDDGLRLRGEMRGAGGQGIDGGGILVGGEQTLSSEEVGEGEHAKAGTSLGEKISAVGDGLETAAMLVSRVHGNASLNQCR